jgi:hypothetical protein
MRLTVTSVVAASGVIDELGHFGAVQVMGKLAATTVCRGANLPAGIPCETGWVRRYRQVSSASIRRFRSFSHRSQEAGVTLNQRFNSGPWPPGSRRSRSG